MAQRYLTYEAFGAVGDGVADDLPAIVETHQAANREGLPVKARPGAVYSLGRRALMAEIRTDVDWSGATFIIDDENPENYRLPLFRVLPDRESYPIELKTLKKGQTALGMTFPTPVFITVENDTVRRFIRYGINQNNGAPARDSFVCAPDGTIKNDVVWDFPTVTAARAFPIDETELTITGGTFRTLANKGTPGPDGTKISQYDYHERGLKILRSHVTVRDLTFLVEREGEIGAPYNGGLSVALAAYVTLENCRLAGHKICITTLPSGPSPMGTYALSLVQCAFVTLRGIRQTNDIMDRSLWGLMGSNYCKDVTLEDCVMSRFDAHQGVTNCTIRNCRLGWQCLNAIGHGHFLIENTEAFGYSLFTLRDDYGSFWDGDLVIRNCRFVPAYAGGTVIRASNPGTHDFGYVCRMPERIEIDGLVIDDTAFRGETTPLYILPDYKPAEGVELPYPLVPTARLIFRGVTALSGRQILPAKKPEQYPNLSVICE